MYDPYKKDSFVMQFGFKHPEWRPKPVNNYIRLADRNNEQILRKRKDIQGENKDL
tara:strand:- start:730 stop:894 length:165 start_codon:yes stop_codon:yes gene_type:complete